MKKVVFLVDDSQFALNRLKEFVLEINSEFEVITEKNSSEAVKKIVEENLRPDCIILDYNMPAPNGLEVVEAVKSVIQLNKIVLNSASSGFSTGGVRIPEGVHFIVKPLDRGQMEGILKKVGVIAA